MEILRYIAGLMAAGLTCAGGFIYVRAVLRRTSRTRWSSWMIWMVTSVMSLATYYGSGARESVWVPAAYVVVCTAIFVAAVWRRSPGGLTTMEFVCLGGAAFAGVVWWASGSAVLGQVASVSIEMVAYIPIWMAARHESKLAWSLETTGSVINLLAISQFTLGLVLYPAAILVCNAAVVVLIYRPSGAIEPVPEMEPVLAMQ